MKRGVRSSGSSRGGIYLDFQASSDSGGGAGVNRTCAEILLSRFTIVDAPERAKLRIKSVSWDAPANPRRIFIDHGSFADASFWTYHAPRLRVDDTILVSSGVCTDVARRFIASVGP